VRTQTQFPARNPPKKRLIVNYDSTCAIVQYVSSMTQSALFYPNLLKLSF
jgi:hypothetical protein